MRFAENNRISHRQLYRQMILALLAPFMLCVFGKGGMNGISAVAGMIFALILLGFYVIWLIRLTPSFEDPVKSAGAFAGRLIGIFFLIYVLMAGGYLLALLRRLVPVKLITGVSGRWIAFWAVLVCSVGTCKGVQRRGRMAEVSGGLLLGGIMIMMILCVPQAKTEYLVGGIRWEELTVRNVRQSFYGTLCAFSPVALLPFLLGNVEKYGSAGKTVAGGILTLGGILIGMELLLPAVLGYDRVAAESYPVLPLLAGADLPGNVLARFDILWMGFLLYSLLFAIGSLLYYGNQIIGKSHPGRGRFWLPALVFLISLLEEEGKGILDYFGWCLAHIFVPGILICQFYMFIRGKGHRRKQRKSDDGVFARHAVEQHEVGAHGGEQFEIEVRVVAHVADLAAETVFPDIGIRDVVDARDARNTLGLSDGVEHRHVARRHAHHVAHGSFYDLSGEVGGGLGVVAQDQQVLFDVRAALPRIADRDERRGVIPVPADVEARRVGRGVNLGCEIAQNWPRRASASRCEGRGKG